MTFDGDSNKYLVAAATATAITLAAPGLRQALADNTAITAGGAYTANMAFDRNAFLLASRTPAMPQGGDTADDVMNVTDPVSAAMSAHGFAGISMTIFLPAVSAPNG